MEPQTHHRLVDRQAQGTAHTARRHPCTHRHQPPLTVCSRAPWPDARRGAYPATDIIALLRDYDFSHQRRLSFEYTMWRGVNDDLRHADALARLLRGLDCRINLIRFHVIPDSDLRPSTTATMEAFRDRLNELGFIATIRASRGEDIMAACGMLAGRQKSNE